MVYDLVDTIVRLSCLAGDANTVDSSAPIESIDKLIIPRIIIEVFKDTLPQRGENTALEAIAHTVRLYSLIILWLLIHQTPSL